MSPCHKCTERVLGCHANCERSKAWNAKREAEKEMTRDKKAKETDFYHVVRKNV